MEPLDSKVKAIKDFKQPETIDQLKRLLGMLNYYRRFIPHAAETQILLLNCTKGNKKKDKTPIIWTPERMKAFRQCKEELANATLLTHPSHKAPLSLNVDASDFAIGGVVNQFIDNCWQPLAFFSKRLTISEKGYSTCDSELFAIYASIKHFRSPRIYNFH